MFPCCADRPQAILSGLFAAFVAFAIIAAGDPVYGSVVPKIALGGTKP